MGKILKKCNNTKVIQLKMDIQSEYVSTDTKNIWEIIKMWKTINNHENANKCYNEIPLIPVRMMLWSRHKFLSPSSASWLLLGPVCGDLETVGEEWLPGESMPPPGQLRTSYPSPNISSLLSTPTRQKMMPELQTPDPHTLYLLIAMTSLPGETELFIMLSQIKLIHC